MLLWAITEDDVIAGLRERGLPVETIDDLTGHEVEYIREYADLVFTTASDRFLDALAVWLRGRRGWSDEEEWR